MRSPAWARSSAYETPLPRWRRSLSDGLFLCVTGSPQVEALDRLPDGWFRGLKAGCGVRRFVLEPPTARTALRVWGPP